jgi:DNA-binding protein H-NS
MVHLETLSFSELRQLQAAVTEAIIGLEQQKAEALAQVQALAEAKGYSLSDLTAPAVYMQRTATPPKYRHPENASLTWSGRGRMPRWFIQAMNAGKTPDELSIV